VFSMSWDLLFGFANEVNFGPTFLVGLGAYTAGILDNRYSLPIPLCVALGTLAAVVGGLVLALPALRLSGPYFGLDHLSSGAALTKSRRRVCRADGWRDRPYRTRRDLD